MVPQVPVFTIHIFIGWLIFVRGNFKRKIGWAWVLKRSQTSLLTTFVLRLFKILRSTSPASASKFKKIAKKHDFFHFFDFFKTTALLHYCTNGSFGNNSGVQKQGKILKKIEILHPKGTSCANID
jgi:hypothetical protein